MAESTIKSCWAQVTTEGKRGRQTGGRAAKRREGGCHLFYPDSRPLFHLFFGSLVGWLHWLAGGFALAGHSTWGVQPAGVAVVGAAAAAAAAVAEGERDMHSILPSKKVTKRAVLLLQ